MVNSIYVRKDEPSFWLQLFTKNEHERAPYPHALQTIPQNPFPEELMSEVLRYLVSIFISQFIIVLRMKGYGQLLCKNVPWEEPAVLLLMHFPCHKDTVCKVIPIAAKGII